MTAKGWCARVPKFGVVVHPGRVKSNGKHSLEISLFKMSLVKDKSFKLIEQHRRSAVVVRTNMLLPATMS